MQEVIEEQRIASCISRTSKRTSLPGLLKSPQSRRKMSFVDLSSGKKRRESTELAARTFIDRRDPFLRDNFAEITEATDKKRMKISAE
jgi:hypothetical protein